MRRLRLALCAVMLVSAAACKVSVHAGRLPDRHPQVLTADERLVRAALLTDATVPTGWKQCCPDQLLTVDDLRSPNGCIAAEDLSGLTAGRMRQFALDLVAGQEKGHLAALVRSATTPAAAQKASDAVASSRYDACLLDSIEEDLHNHLGRDAILEPSVVTRVDRHLPLPGGTRLIATPFTQNGSRHVHYEDFIMMVSGRLRATLVFDAIEPADLGPQAWEQSVQISREPEIIATAARKLTEVQS